MDLYERRIRALRREKAKLTIKQAREVEAILNGAIEDLAEKAKGPSGLGNEWAKNMQAELKRTRDQVARDIAKSQAEGISRGIELTLDVERGVTEEMLKAGKVDIAVDTIKSLTNVRLDTIQDLTGKNLYADGKTLSDRIWTTTNKLDKNIDYIIAQAVARKASAKDMAKDLEEFILQPWERSREWRERNPHISFIDPRAHALRLARTTINHTHQVATIRASRNNPFNEGLEWLTSGNHGQVCSICEEREGQIYEPEDVPLDHPNGMCTVAPVITKSYEEIGKDLNQWSKGELEDEELSKALDNWLLGPGDRRVIPQAKPKDPRPKDKPKVPVDEARVRQAIDEELADYFKEERALTKGLGKIDRDRIYKAINTSEQKELGAFIIDIVDEFGATYNRVKSAEGAWYSPHFKTINLSYRERGTHDGVTTNSKTYFHELGHAWDHALGVKRSGKPNKALVDLIGKELREALEKDFTEKTGFTFKNNKMQDYDGERAYKVSKEIMGDRYSSVSDVYGGLSRRLVRGNWGHSKKYWSDWGVNGPGMEWWAHYTEAKIHGGERLKALEEYTPNALKYADEIIEEELRIWKEKKAKELEEQ